MIESLVPVLCCPVCRASLRASVEALSCEKCEAKYTIEKGIARLHVADDEVIARSDQSKGAEYIIDATRLDAWVNELGNMRFEPKQRRMFVKRISVFAIVGCVLVALTSLLLLANGVLATLGWIWPVGAGVLALVAFVVDFIQYRAELADRYRYQRRRLVELHNASILSDFDIHEKQKGDHEEEEEGDPSGDARKAAEISRRLDNYQELGKNGLNVGCGGELHQLISQQFFEHGFDMIGVDTFDVYVEQYSRLFNVPALQANAMALPFKSNKFDMVNFCDIIEHLHHPYLGLTEVHRVMKKGGILILSTNYRCRLSRDCANPLIFIERIISVIDDRVLGPRDMLRGFRDMEFYHLDFSRHELMDLIEAAGFEIVEFYTYLTKRQSLSNLLNKVPIFRYLGDAILITCKKLEHSAPE